MGQNSGDALRDEVLELVRLIGDLEAQRRYEGDVPIANVPAELICMWFDDLYHPDAPQFIEAFSAAERTRLEEFSRCYEARLEALRDVRSVDALHAHQEWTEIARMARQMMQDFEPR